MKYIISLIIGVSMVILILSIGFYATEILTFLFSLSPLLMLLILFNKKLRKNTYIFNAILVYTFIIFAYVLIKSYKYMIFDAFSFTLLVYFVITIVFGIRVTKVQQNNTFGIRTRFTLAYPVIWHKTHNFMSIAEMVTIPTIFVLIFFLDGWTKFLIGTAAYILPILVSTIYSNIIGKKYHKFAEMNRKQELKA